ncbi:prosome, macropain 26S subunit, non-ATPase, 10, isoform CRA_c [Circinella umbellata]|nr:prosome, macropain 26S subunit, non-ATPase, 10, isoform CRA_c [Circinella umbellata]
MLNIYTAAYEGKLFIVQQLIDKDISCLNEKDEDDRTPLHWACSGGHGDIVDYLISKGALVNAIDDSGWSPLMITASAGHIGPTESLIKQGADLSLQNESGQTALHYAASKNRIEIVKLLLLENNKVQLNQVNNIKQTPL